MFIYFKLEFRVKVYTSKNATPKWTNKTDRKISYVDWNKLLSNSIHLSNSICYEFFTHAVKKK